MEISAQNIRFIFGLKLKQLRTENNYSLSQLSKLTKISKSYLNEIEKGKKYPKPEKISALAQALNTNYNNLVSLQLDNKLAPISSLIKSNVLNELPLDFFGISAQNLLVLLSNAPTQFSAFVDAIIRIGREHDFKVESLYFSVLRSYQEMYNNYFPELEKAAQTWRKQFPLRTQPNELIKSLEAQLKKHYKYQINYDGFSGKPYLKNLRYLFVPAKTPVLLVNKNLSNWQVIFILSRELSYKRLHTIHRPFTSSWIETKSFEHVLANFKSYYLASAYLLDERSFTKGLVDFTKKKKFNPNDVVSLIRSTNVSAEAFMLRITNLVPRYFRYPNLFFTRYNHSLNDNIITLTKALNGSGIGDRKSNYMELKACQRWVAVQNLNQLRKSIKPFCSIYKVKYENNTQEYLVISMTHSVTPATNLNCTISVGFLINNRFMSQTKFAHDTSIKTHVINQNWVNEQLNVYDGISTRPILQREYDLGKIRDEINKIVES